jgi:tRNA pseudouridine38-40 synthase
MQKGSITVQEEIEKALSKILRASISVMGCGRTDAGVHASQFFLHFDFDGEIGEQFLFRINQLLPKDIAVYTCFQVSEEFHARFKATYRKYIYRVNFVKNPFLEDLSLFLLKEPNLEAMNIASKELLLSSDFAAFCKMGSGNNTTICKVMEAEWKYDEQERILEFHIKADRFLRNMVRAIVGTLLQVGYGNLQVDEMQDIIKSKNRSSSGKSVAAKGLYLTEVGYNWNEFRA